MNLAKLQDTKSIHRNHLHVYIRSDQIRRSVVYNSLWPHESQHTRPPCPSPEFTDSRPLSQWCHPAISSSVVPFSSCPQSLPASESFPMSQLFAWGGQSTGVSALASFLPKNTQGWSSSEWTGWHHWLNGRESVNSGDGQGGLVCCDSWGHKELYTTERRIWSDIDMQVISVYWFCILQLC